MVSSPAARPISSPGDASEDHRRSVEWDLSSGPGNYAALVGAQVASSGLAFAAIWLATRALGPSGYGGVVAVIAASQIVGQMTVEWSTLSLFRYGCEEFVRDGRIANAFWNRSILLIPNLLIVIALSHWWLPPVATWLQIPPNVYPLVAIHFLVTAIWAHVQRALQAAKLPRLQAYLLSFERALVVALLMGLIYAGVSSVFSVALCWIAAPCLASIVGIWRLGPLIYPGVEINYSLLKQMLVFSLPLVPYSIIGSLFTSQLDAFFITRFLSVTALGVYAVAYQFAGTIMQLPLHAGSLLSPLFVTLQVEGQDERMARFLREIMPVLTLLWSIGCALFAVIGGVALPLLFGLQFRETPIILWPLMAAAALAGPWLMGYVPAFNAKSATHVGTVAGVSSSIVNIVLNALLVPRFGLIGCAWATTAAYGAMMLVGAHFIYKQIPSSRGWAIQSTMPTILGAAYASWQADAVGGFGVTVFMSGLICLFRRRAIIAGARALKSVGTFNSVLRVMPGR